MAKLRVGVMYGGSSFEHDISILTALQAIPAVAAAGYEPVPLYCSPGGEWRHGAGLDRIDTYRSGLPQAPVVSLAARDGRLIGYRRRFGCLATESCLADVILPCFHGAPGEAGALTGPFEAAGVPVASSSTIPLALAMDKIAAKAVVAAAGVPVLPGVALRRSDDIPGSVSFPAIVKPVTLGSSIGVARVADRDELAAAVETAFRLDDRVLIEPALDDFREINCSVAGFVDGPRVSPCEEVFPDSGILSFADKYRGGRGGKGGAKEGVKGGGSKEGGMARCSRVVPAALDDLLAEKISAMALAAFGAIGCEGVVRIDFLVDRNGHPWFNELNAIPGSLSYYLWEAGGVSFPHLLRGLIERAAIRAARSSRRIVPPESQIFSRLHV